ncbi:MAG: restriction endonuclease [Gemmatimonadota bacterium]|nr:restriction endonuclease [Gemmatimonadota bacterium]
MAHRKSNAKIVSEKRRFVEALRQFAATLPNMVTTLDGEWTVKGFIDVYKNIYTISSDTKIVSKILEIHLFPKILHLADRLEYSIVLAEHQNWYPDLSLVNRKDESVKFALDLKTTYRDPIHPGHANGFTLGSHGSYFRNRTSTKNVQFPYSAYAGHFCLGLIYSRADKNKIDEFGVTQVGELKGDSHDRDSTLDTVVEVSNLQSIASVIKDFEFFVCEKWQLASDRQGSGNTANIGSITYIEDIVRGHGVFAKLGEHVFDEYWMNYNVTTMLKAGKVTPIRRIEDFLEFKGGNPSLIVPMKTKRKGRK